MIAWPITIVNVPRVKLDCCAISMMLALQTRAMRELFVKLIWSRVATSVPVPRVSSEMNVIKTLTNVTKDRLASMMASVLIPRGLIVVIVPLASLDLVVR